MINILIDLCNSFLPLFKNLQNLFMTFGLFSIWTNFTYILNLLFFSLNNFVFHNYLLYFLLNLFIKALSWFLTYHTSLLSRSLNILGSKRLNSHIMAFKRCLSYFFTSFVSKSKGSDSMMIFSCL